MEICINEKNEITSYAILGSLIDGIQIDNQNVPSDFEDNFQYRSYIYENGEIKNNPIFSSIKRAEEIEQEIIILKQQLFNTDYKTMKYIEGQLSEEEYTIAKQERQKIRDQINDLLNELEQLNKII